MTDKYDGRVTLLDDDPAPELRIRTPKRVSEGATIRIKVSLTADTGYDSYVSVHAVRGIGPGRPAHGRRPPVGVARAATTSSRTTRATRSTSAGLYLYDRLRPGQRTGEVDVPIRVDSLREGTERLSFRIHFEPAAGDPDDPGRRLTPPRPCGFVVTW